MNRKLKTTGACVLTTAAVALGPGAGAAAALVPAVYYETTPDNWGGVLCEVGVGTTFDGGYGCFKHDGDVFYVTDHREDGKSVAVEYKTGDGSEHGLVRNKDGSDFAQNRGKKNLDLPENKALGIRIGLCNQTATRSCRSVAHYDWTTAWAWGNTSG